MYFLKQKNTQWKYDSVVCLSEYHNKIVILIYNFSINHDAQLNHVVQGVAKKKNTTKSRFCCLLYNGIDIPLNNSFRTSMMQWIHDSIVYRGRE